MTPKTIVKISNTIGIISIVLLIYWVFVFMTVEVFGLKVFRENITQTFYFSVFGIIALMFGALMINIMFNLTRIAQKHNGDSDIKHVKKSKILLISVLLSFPIILGFLFGGDYLTSKKKQNLLIQSAENIINEAPAQMKELIDYSFTKNWINETGAILHLFSKTDSHFPNVSIVVKDSIKGLNQFLEFRSSYGYISRIDTIAPQKIEFIFKTTKHERDYLKTVFKTKSTKIRFSAHDGKYELFYPYVKNGKVMVFYFTDRNRYGKIGS
jgi:hypothetical protein